jgi:site-specific recombinase XerD
MLLQDAIQERLAALRRLKRSPRTVEWYAFWLMKFDASLLIHDVELVSLRDLRAFIDGLEALNDTSVHGAQIALKAFFKWSVQEGLLTVNPADRLEVCKIPKREPDTLDTASVLALLNEAQRSSKPERNRAIIGFIVESGFRLQEAVCLLPKDLDIEARVVWTSAGTDGRNSAKGNKQRFVPFGVVAQLLLREWFAVRSDALDTVFGLTGWGVRDMLDDLSVKVGIRVTPHMLRRTSATLRAEENVQGNTLQAIMGWERPETAKHYVDRARLMVDARKSSPMDRVNQLSENQLVKSPTD